MRLLVRIVFIFILVCTISCQDRNEEQSVNKQMGKITSETGLTFPTNSRLDHFLEADVLVDPVWVAKVVVPASSYASFTQAMLTKPEDKTVYQGALADSTSWWRPTNIVLTKQYLADRHTFVKIVVSKEDEEFAVYIECAVF